MGHFGISSSIERVKGFAYFSQADLMGLTKIMKLDIPVQNHIKSTLY
jgi:hypothetical protein